MMPLKQTIENNPVVVYVSAMVIAFLAGWAAHSVVQSASGLTPVSAERAKLAENYAQERDTLTFRIASLEREKASLDRDLSMAQKAASAADAGVLPSPEKAASAAIKLAPKHTALAVPAPVDSSVDNLPISVGPIYFDAQHGIYKVGEDITMLIDYKIEAGRSMSLWLYPPKGSGFDYTYSPSGSETGNGVLRRTFRLTEPGHVKAVELWGSIGGGATVRIKRWDIDLQVAKK